MSSTQNVESFYRSVALAEAEARLTGNEQPVRLEDEIYYVSPQGTVRLVASHGMDLDIPLETMKDIQEEVRYSKYWRL